MTLYTKRLLITLSSNSSGKFCRDGIFARIATLRRIKASGKHRIRNMWASVEGKQIHYDVGRSMGPGTNQAQPESQVAVNGSCVGFVARDAKTDHDERAA